MIGVLLASLFVRLSSAVEVSRPDGLATFQSRFGLHRSRGVVLKLCSLFGLDAFAGGFVIQSIVAYWFHVRFGVDPATLGGIFFGANILAGICSRGCMGCRADRPCQYNGLHASAFQYPLTSRSLNAQLALGNCCFAPAIQHFANGRSPSPILHNGCGCSRRTLRGRRRDRDYSNHRRVSLSRACRLVD